MEIFLYLYHANHHSDMENKSQESKKIADLDKVYKLFREMLDAQEKQGFPSSSYIREKKRNFKLEIDYILRDIC